MKTTHAPYAAPAWTPDLFAACLEPEATWVASPLRPSAILLPLLEREDGWHLLFIRRSMAVMAHRGQIGCPGGRREPDENSPTTTALRETQEEIGLNQDLVQVLGHLPAHATLNTGFMIHPIVGIMPAESTLHPDTREVAEILILPLVSFTMAEHLVASQYQHPDGSVVPIYEYHIAGERIWGATASILHTFINRLLAIPAASLGGVNRV